MNKLSALIAIAGTAGLLFANAEAATMSEVPTVAVRYADLNLTSSHDAAVLYRRIDAAAGKVCGERLAPGSAFVSKPWHQCVQNALRRSVAVVNAPAVTAYAAAQGVLAYDSRMARSN